MAIAPWLLGDPLNDVVAIAAHVQPEIVTLDPAGTATAAHVHLHEHVAAPAIDGVIATAAAIDVVLSQGEYRGRFAFQV
jgi:Asp/Glu/hydantoin racemase